MPEQETTMTQYMNPAHERISLNDTKSIMPRNRFIIIYVTDRYIFLTVRLGGEISSSYYDKLQSTGKMISLKSQKRKQSVSMAI